MTALVSCRQSAAVDYYPYEDFAASMLNCLHFIHISIFFVCINEYSFLASYIFSPGIELTFFSGVYGTCVGKLSPAANNALLSTGYWSG